MKRFLKNLLGLFVPFAYDKTNMNALKFGTGRMFFYISADAIAVVAASAYFDLAVDKVKNGDIIFAVDTNVPTVDMLTVTSADNVTPVTVLNGT